MDEDNLSSTSTTTPTPRIASTVSISPRCYTIVIVSIITFFDVEGLSFQEPFAHTHYCYHFAHHLGLWELSIHSEES